MKLIVAIAKSLPFNELHDIFFYLPIKHLLPICVEGIAGDRSTTTISPF
jgi:hypothetical protein